MDYVVFWLRKVTSGSVGGPAGGREKVVERIRFGPWDDVRRSIDQHISVYYWLNDHTVYRICSSRSLESY
jgi:hypothetical protein